MTQTTQTIVHASCVAFDRRAVLLRGASGSGKSALALQLMALGAVLIADDRVILGLRDGAVFARCPASIRGRIEARGVGILAAETAETAIVQLVVDLDRQETERLPPQRETTLLGQRIPLLHAVRSAHFPAAILQYLKGGRSD